MENTFIIKAYLIYLPIVLALTVYVAKQLFKNSEVFMLDIFNGRESIALATNKLFEVGFYLMNCGFAMLILQITDTTYNPFNTYQDLIETLSTKIGGFAIYLGIMLFINLFLFFRGKKASKKENNPQKTIIQDA